MISKVCPQSIEAIAGSVAAVCQAVDISVRQETTVGLEDEASEIKVEPKTESSLEALVSMSLDEHTGVSNVEPSGIEASQVPLPPSPTPKISGRHYDRGSRVFTAIRPPGHHCSDDVPSGFCFVNNVMIGAAHGELALKPMGTAYLVTECEFHAFPYRGYCSSSLALWHPEDYCTGLRFAPRQWISGNCMVNQRRNSSTRR